jgi:hypothetical protein
MHSALNPEPIKLNADSLLTCRVVVGWPHPGTSATYLSYHISAFVSDVTRVFYAKIMEAETSTDNPRQRQIREYPRNMSRALK